MIKDYSKVFNFLNPVNLYEYYAERTFIRYNYFVNYDITKDITNISNDIYKYVNNINDKVHNIYRGIYITSDEIPCINKSFKYAVYNNIGLINNAVILIGSDNTIDSPSVRLLKTCGFTNQQMGITPLCTICVLYPNDKSKCTFKFFKEKISYILNAIQSINSKNYIKLTNENKESVLLGNISDERNWLSHNVMLSMQELSIYDNLAILIKDLNKYVIRYRHTQLNYQYPIIDTTYKNLLELCNKIINDENLHPYLDEIIIKHNFSDVYNKHIRNTYDLCNMYKQTINHELLNIKKLHCAEEKHDAFGYKYANYWGFI